MTCRVEVVVHRPFGGVRLFSYLPNDASAVRGMAHVTRLGILIGLTVALFLPCAPSTRAQAVPESLRFAEAVSIAESANLDFRAVQRLENLMRAQLQSARSRINPTVIAQAEEYPEFIRAGVPRTGVSTWFVHLQQELETAGKWRHRTQAATAELAATQAQVDDFRRTLVEATGTAYFEMAQAQLDYDALRSLQTQNAEVIGLIEQRVAQGDEAEIALLRLQFDQSRLDSDVLAAELTYTNARATLLALLGTNTPTQTVVAIDSLSLKSLVGKNGVPIASPEGVLASLEELLALAERHRPDLSAVRLRVEQSEASVRLQRAMRIPNIAVIGGYRRGHHLNFAEVGVTFEIPVWNGLDNGGLAVAEAARRVAAAESEQLTYAARSEVVQAVQMVSAMAAQMRVVEENYLTLAEQLVPRIRRSFELGEATLSDVIDIQRDRADAQILRNEVVCAYRISLVTLASALGMAPDLQDL